MSAPTPPTAAELAEWEQVCEKATPGPWLNAGWDKSRGQTVVADKHQFSVCQCYGLTPAFAHHEASMSHNAIFIAAARLGFPAVCRALLECRAELENGWTPAKELAKTLDDVVELRESLAAARQENERLRTILHELSERHAYSPYFENGYCVCEWHELARTALAEPNGAE